MASCRSCGAEVIWAKTVNGKAMPLDAYPVEDGNIVLAQNETGEDVAVYLRKNEVTAEQRYVSHFATCPDAKEHRR